MNSENVFTEVPFMENEKRCDCGFINKPDAKFCSSCGIELKGKCQEPNESKICFCNQCGNKLTIGDLFCNKCGNRMGEDAKKLDNNESNEEKTFDVKNVIQKYDVSKRNTVVKILSIIALICFLMPFVKESALGFDMSMNGIEVALGTFFGEETRYMADSESIPANLWLIMSLISCGIALIYNCQAWDLEELVKTSGGFHIASGIFLVIYKLSYSVYYGETEWDFLVSVEHGFAVWAIIFINAIAGVIAWVNVPEEGQSITENQ